MHRHSSHLYFILYTSVTIAIIHRSSSYLPRTQYPFNQSGQIPTPPSIIVCTYYLCINVDPNPLIIIPVFLLWRTHHRALVEVSSKFRWVLVCSRISCFILTHFWRVKWFTSMCMALYIRFLGFYIIISAVLSHNNFVCPCIENTRSSRVEEIHFSYLDPEATVINSASVEIVDSVACILIF